MLAISGTAIGTGNRGVTFAAGGGGMADRIALLLALVLSSAILGWMFSGIFVTGIINPFVVHRNLHDK
jgi:hypothetical protein